MKDVVLSKDLPMLRVEYDGASQSLFGKLPNTPDFGTYVDAPGAADLWLYEDTIDIAGMTVEDMTFFPISGDVQRPATSMGVIDGFATEFILVTVSPLPTDEIGTYITDLNMWNHLPGQFLNGGSFQNIMWGKAWVWTRNTTLIQNFGVAVNTSLLGSGEPTNGDKLYVYRMVRITAPVNPGLAEFPACRLLLSGQLKKEDEYKQIMRMRRTYELQQSYDED